MHLRHAIAALLAVGTISVAPTAMAEAPADFAGFSTSCMAASPFLLGDVPEGVDAASILTPLCGCLVTAFAPLSQKDVDMLASDLAGKSDDASRAAHGDYATLEETARQGLNACFSDPAVTAAMDAAVPPEAAAPAAQ